MYLYINYLSLKSGEVGRVSDKNGNIMLDESDLMKNSKMSVKEFTSQVAPFFIAYNKDLKNPLSCYCLIWDKNSDKSISAEFQVNVVQ
ncbi:MAG: hypothetical protein HPY79_09060 [Bacteroidales bacterium]|nr:hypothetical protein [Bacteroidales bacterium]